MQKYLVKQIEENKEDMEELIEFDKKVSQVTQ